MDFIPADSGDDDTVRVTRGPKTGDFEPEEGKSSTILLESKYPLNH